MLRVNENVGEHNINIVKLLADVQEEMQETNLQVISLKSKKHSVANSRGVQNAESYQQVLSSSPLNENCI